MRTSRSIVISFVSFLLAGLAVVGSAGAASAEDAYAYWLYYTVADGKLVYQETAGPATFVPEDGGIEAYRYAAAVFPPKQAPRIDLEKVTFDAVCGDTEAETGKKRVAVVIDYGIDGDAPAGGPDAPDPVAECAVVATDANGLQTLQSVAKVRTGDQSSLCAIDAYPSGGECFAAAPKESAADGDPVTVTIAGDDADGTGKGDDEDTNTLLYAGFAGIFVVLVAGGAFLARRRSSAS